MKPILEINDVSKRFRIRHQSGGYLSIREKILNIFKRRTYAEEFWALNHVGFDVNAGESVGILGRNGAGKSTLLKILSKITPPTMGRIISRGRIASLLEVGTGFHPELTGRENIFFNGSLLGLRRLEIKSLFSDIVEFSGVERFLDTPLKHYSSGMQLRLAFSVAAFLEPEILIIDEVLAVGDSVFQQKCIEKMTEVSRSGRTILFVSHNLSAVKLLCTRGIVLDNGRVAFDGSAENAIDFYNQTNVVPTAIVNLSDIVRKKYKHDLVFDTVNFNSNPIGFGEPILLGLKLKSRHYDVFHELDFGINFSDKNNNCIIHVSNRFLNQNISHESDSTIYKFSIENILKPGSYKVTLFLRVGTQIQDYLTDVLLLEVLDGNPYKYSDTQSIQGSVLPHFSIEIVNQS